MSRYDWLLFLHVLSAFAVVAAVVLFSVVIAAGRQTDVPSEVERLFRVARVGDVLVGVGSVGVLIFGIWLALNLDQYDFFDGWILLARP